MLSPENLIAGVKATLQGISGIDAATVYDYRREVKNEADAALLWHSATQDRIHAWSVTLSSDETATSAREPGFSRTVNGPINTDFGIELEGVMGIDDAAASEKTFRALCWTVTLAFNRIALLRVANADPTLDLAIGDVVHQEAMQWRKFGYLWLANAYPVHYCRMACRFTGRVA